MIAMGIVSPADKKGTRSNFPHAISDDAIARSASSPS